LTTFDFPRALVTAAIKNATEGDMVGRRCDDVRQRRQDKADVVDFFQNADSVF
jgi:hypothetical protein